MKAKYIVTAIVGVLLLGFGAAVYARAQWGGRYHGRGALIAQLTRKFDLTPAQQNEVKQVWQSEKPSILPLVQQLAQLNRQMAEATSGGMLDQAKVASIANQESQVLSQLIVEKEKLTVKFYALLTPEQRTRFDSMRQRRLTRIDEFVKRMATEGAEVTGKSN